MNTQTAALAANAVPSPIHVSTPSRTVEVELDGGAIRATIVERDTDLVGELAQMDAGQRARFVENGWTIGLRAAMNAHRLASESRLEDIGQEITSAFGTQLERYHQEQQAALGRALSEYFDPQSGRVPTRIDQFLRDGGDLERTMDKYLAPEGELAKVIARSFGEASPLMKRLSPTDSEGVVKLFEEKLRLALDKNQSALAVALDPTTQNGALTRFFKQLKADLKAASDDRDRQLSVITKALDTTDKTSAMSAFFADSRRAYRDLAQSMNAEDPSSPLGAIKAGLSSLLEKHAKAQQEALAVIDDRQRKDGAEMREALARFEERRRCAARSTAAGTTFEDALTTTIAGMLRGADVTVVATGGKVGSRPSCKVGDQVVRYAADHKFAGSAVVIEAKHDASYTVTDALKELEIAQANRDATAGLFVMAASHAAPGFPRFQRFGTNVVVVWDDGDPDTDDLLQAALSLALFVAPQARRTDDRGDIEAIRRIEGRIAGELKRYEELRKIADAVRGSADKLADEARKGAKALRIMLGEAQQTLKALDLPVLDAHDPRESTLMLPGLAHDAAE